MRELVPGHRFALQNLKSRSETILQFYQDPDLHDGEGAAGPSTQEVIRACIKRVQELDREKRWVGNDDIVHHLRCAIAGFEARALIRQVEKDDLEIETLPVLSNGHIDWRTE
jgi:hypothetical protein